MDGLDFHPYPVPQSLPFATGLRRPALGERHEPAADLPGVLRRVQRDAAADDRPAEGRRPAGQPQRDRRPDRHVRQARLQRQRDLGERGRRRARPVRDRELPGDLVPPDARPRRLRPERRRGQHLPPRSTRRTSPAGRAGSTSPTGAPKQSAQVVRDWIARTGGRCPGKATLVDGGRAHPGADTRRRRRRPKPAKVKPPRPSRRRRRRSRALTGEHLFGSITNRCSPRSSHSWSLRSSSGRSPRGRPAPTATRRSTASGRTTRSGRSRPSHYSGDVRDAIWRIQKANHLSGATIQPGERLLFPAP